MPLSATSSPFHNHKRSKNSLVFSTAINSARNSGAISLSEHFFYFCLRSPCLAGSPTAAAWVRKLRFILNPKMPLQASSTNNS